MEPITLTVIDENVSFLLNSDESHGSWKETNSGKVMFPTNIQYIFENDATPNNGTNGGDTDIENIIIIDLDESLSIEDIELISDKYEMLSYRKNEMVDAGKQDDEPSGLDIEIDVLSKFKALTSSTNELSLEKLIELYNTQNEQLEQLSRSII